MLLSNPDRSGLSSKEKTTLSAMIVFLRDGGTESASLPTGMDVDSGANGATPKPSNANAPSAPFTGIPGLGTLPNGSAAPPPTNFGFSSAFGQILPASTPLTASLSSGIAPKRSGVVPFDFNTPPRSAPLPAPSPQPRSVGGVAANTGVYEPRFPEFKDNEAVKKWALANREEVMVMSNEGLNQEESNKLRGMKSFLSRQNGK